MQPPQPSHAADEQRPPSVWTSESVLRERDWRERPSDRLGGDTAVPDALESEPRRTPREQVRRAVVVPVLAGAVVLVVAVIITILVTVLRQPASVAFELDGPGAGQAVDAQGADVQRADAHAVVADADADADADAALPGTVLYVHVVGEVVHPGVVEVPSGARVAEAIEVAGGATETAVLASVNLAREVVDGEQILVPNADQVATAEASAVPGSSTGSLDSGGSAGVAGGLVKLNTATAAELETLPRVGPALAQRIIDWREANGPFSSVDDLLEVSGIGIKTLDGFRDQVTP